MSNLIELPGMKGRIAIDYDISNGAVSLDAGGTDLRTIVQVLLMATQGAVAQWIQIDNRIIRTDGGKENGSTKENGSSKKDDDDDGGGSTAA